AGGRQAAGFEWSTRNCPSLSATCSSRDVTFGSSIGGHGRHLSDKHSDPRNNAISCMSWWLIGPNRNIETSAHLSFTPWLLPVIGPFLKQNPCPTRLYSVSTALR